MPLIWKRRRCLFCWEQKREIQQCPSARGAAQQEGQPCTHRRLEVREHVFPLGGPFWKKKNQPRTCINTRTHKIHLLCLCEILTEVKTWHRTHNAACFTRAPSNQDRRRSRCNIWNSLCIVNAHRLIRWAWSFLNIQRARHDGSYCVVPCDNRNIDVTQCIMHEVGQYRKINQMSNSLRHYLQHHKKIQLQKKVMCSPGEACTIFSFSCVPAKTELWLVSSEQWPHSW